MQQETVKKIQNYEQAIMEIIVNGGDARSACLKAIRNARKGEFAEAEQLMMRAEESLSKAHAVQTMLIQDEIRSKKNEISLLIIHAQDHLMNAMTVKDLAVELIAESRLRLDIEERLRTVLKNG
ncbi:MAG TPA: PTS lactose/cellobiose transporter subunit IIA [Eubacteriaceae bacterium]|jgi:PTS system cellobiose-specific IIA component|nr:PTS lactose/cellobiose transporter subunit IIA [Eubacteriaceae bacterium]